MHFSFDKSDKFLCHCSDDILLAEKNCEIRPNVCRDLPKYGEIDGKEYCILHYPSKNKTADFIKIFDERFEEGEFYFCGIWFPCEVVYTQEVFGKDVDFSHATFADDVEFMGTTFAGEANFYNAKFLGFAAFETAIFKKEAQFRYAKFSKDPCFFGITFEENVFFSNGIFHDQPTFNGVRFLSNASFSSVKFLEGCDFSEAKFNSFADFNSTKFQKESYFDKAIFKDEVDFSYSVFEEDSSTTFRNTHLTYKTNLSFSIFKGYIHFEGGNYEIYSYPNDYDNPVGEPRFTNVFENEADFSFARIEKSELTTFYKVRLCPSWFVNLDVRKMNFTDVIWENCDGQLGDLETEIKRLEVRELSNPNYLLLITYRNLSDTLKNQYRLEESEKFNEMASLIEKYKIKSL